MRTLWKWLFSSQWVKRNIVVWELDRDSIEMELLITTHMPPFQSTTDSHKFLLGDELFIGGDTAASITIRFEALRVGDHKWKFKSDDTA